MPDQLQSTLNSAPAIIYISNNMTKTIQWCNKTFEKESGYSLSEMKDMGLEFFRNIMHPDDFPKALEAQHKFEAGELKSYFGHCRIKGKKEKEWKWVAGSAIPGTFDNEGNIKDVICTFLPISKKSNTPKQTEKAFRAMLRKIHRQEIQLITSKEKDVISLIMQGYSIKMAAEKLGIKEVTVEFHLTQMRKKLEVPNIAALVSKVKDIGL